MNEPEGFMRIAAVGYVQGEISPGAAAFLDRQAAEYGFRVVEIDDRGDPRKTQRRIVKQAAWAVQALEQRYGSGVADTCTLYVSPDLTPVEVETALRVVMLAPGYSKTVGEPPRKGSLRKVTVEVMDSWTRQIGVRTTQQEATSENKSH